MCVVGDFKIVYSSVVKTVCTFPSVKVLYKIIYNFPKNPIRGPKVGDFDLQISTKSRLWPTKNFQKSNFEMYLCADFFLHINEEVDNEEIDQNKKLFSS
jgi:hypothetical protein